MAEEINKIEELSKRLDKLLSMHNDVSSEIDNLRVEIIRLKVDQKLDTEAIGKEDVVDSTPISDSSLETEIIESTEIESTPSSSLANDLETGTEETSEVQDIAHEEDSGLLKYTIGRKTSSKSSFGENKKFDLEKLIGENLINKIGILVFVIGVAIGAKYSIENDFISPLTRIILGYGTGIVLLGLGMYLKKNYLNFSAVLVSGAMAILYFITFFAFDFYQLIGQEVAFGLMVLFTIFTVFAALKYDKEVIAHLGLVGAISVPFLLSNDAGNVLFLFTYVTIINLGIAFISLRKNWKILFYSAFAITWVVYFTWIAFDYEISTHFTLAFSFLTVFFVLFYVIFIAYKFIKLKKYNAADVIVLLLNSLIFFGIGYALLSEHEKGKQLLGVFAIANALFHFIAAYIINTRKLADRNLFYLIIGLVLTCLTLAIPIQLDGHWVTMMWSAEALLLFYIGRSRKVAFYEYISFALMGIAAISLSQDWESKYISTSRIYTYQSALDTDVLAPLLNSVFLTSCIALLCLGAIAWIHFNSAWRKETKVDNLILKLLDYAIPISLIAMVFLALRMEILNHFNVLYAGSGVDSSPDRSSFFSKTFNNNIMHKGNIWLITYALVFFSVLSYIIINKVKNIKANWAMIGINFIIIGVFLIQGLYELSELRENYLSQENSEYFNITNSFLWLRYMSLLCLALLVGCTYYLLKKINKDYKIRIVSDTTFYLIILWVSTSELIHWLDFTEKSETYGLALSIFWGIFSVIMIALGIWKKKKHIRILGIVIFGITLIKLFFWDLSHLTTISKTIVMISLGALLLLTSFLYNKYKIEDEPNM